MHVLHCSVYDAASLFMEAEPAEGHKWLFVSSCQRILETQKLLICSWLRSGDTPIPIILNTAADLISLRRDHKFNGASDLNDT